MSKNTVYRFSREHIKQSDMISGYGAGEELVKKQLKADLKEMYFDGIEKTQPVKRHKPTNRRKLNQKFFGNF